MNNSPLKIVVASENPVKINSALKGFQEMFPIETFEIEGIDVPSGVNAQPLGNSETYQGALNRATNAKNDRPFADFWIGIEGGNIPEGNEMEVMAWVVVLSNDQTGKARTAGFYLPQRTIQLVREGYELGAADEIVFGIQNSKQKMGSSGLLTDNVMDRERFYISAVILALIPFKKKELYEN